MSCTNLVNELACHHAQSPVLLAGTSSFFPSHVYSKLLIIFSLYCKYGYNSTCALIGKDFFAMTRHNEICSWFDSTFE